MTNIARWGWVWVVGKVRELVWGRDEEKGKARVI